MSAVCVADVGVATLYLVVCTKLVVSDVYTVDLACCTVGLAAPQLCELVGEDAELLAQEYF